MIVKSMMWLVKGINKQNSERSLVYGRTYVYSQPHETHSYGEDIVAKFVINAWY